jgi:uncharacterized small protein (TIGR04563 family)
MAADHKDKSLEKSDKRKQSLYFPEDMLEEIQKEAMRQDRSLSWIVQKAWKIAREQIRKFPSVNDVVDENEKDDERELNPTAFRERPDRT